MKRIFCLVSALFVLNSSSVFAADSDQKNLPIISDSEKIEISDLVCGEDQDCEIGIKAIVYNSLSLPARWFAALSKEQKRIVFVVGSLGVFATSTAISERVNENET